eukprot:38317-Eustigmatos_ZCMA.PRE.1
MSDQSMCCNQSSLPSRLSETVKEGPVSRGHTPSRSPVCPALVTFGSLSSRSTRRSIRRALLFT